MTNIVPEKGNTPPPLWELGKDRKPKNMGSFDKCIEFFAAELKKESNWIVNHDQEAKKYLRLLDKTEILSKEGKQLHATLRKKYPKLFGRVLIDFNGVKRFIPQARLTGQSEKFSRMLSIGFQESKLREITFKDNNYDKKIISQFLQYLETGKIELDGDNLLVFFCLADEHLLPELTELCEIFVSVHGVVGDSSLLAV